MKTVSFRGYKCNVLLRKYVNGTPRIDLVDAKTGEPICVATVNIPDYPLTDGWIHIKDYSENEGILDVLEKAGVVTGTVFTSKCGFTKAIICKLHKEFFEEDKNQLEKQKQEWWSQQNDDEEYLRDQGEIE